MTSSAPGNRFLRHRRRRVTMLVVATVLSLLIPLLMVYFSTCARTQAVFDSEAGMTARHPGRGRADRGPP